MVKGGFGLLGGLVSDVREKRGGSCGLVPIYFVSGKRIVFYYYLFVSLHLIEPFFRKN